MNHHPLAREKGGDSSGSRSATVLARDWWRLDAPVDALSGDGIGPVTHLMYLIWLVRLDLQRAFDIFEPRGRLGFIIWVLEFGREEYDLAPGRIPSYDLAALREAVARASAAAPATGAAPPSTGSAMLEGIWAGRPDLQSAYPLDSARGRTGFLRWLAASGIHEYPIPRRIVATELWRAGLYGPCLRLVVGALRRRLAARFRPGRNGEERPAAPEPTERPIAFESLPQPIVSIPGRAVPPSELAAPGVTLIGYARGELGIGEDVRTAARALATTETPFGVLDFSHGLGSRQTDTSSDRWLTDSCRHRANLFCVAGMEMARAYLTLGEAVFDRRYNIGYWPWELPEWPRACHGAFAFVDEVWASTRFAAEALGRSSPVPVIRMPLAVTVDLEQRFERRAFGLPRDRYLFLFAFDFRSFIARKNPFASLEAFRRAFPSGREKAGLVVKVMNASPGDPNWQRVRRAAAEDPRIHLIEETLPRQAMLGLVDCCDAFLSLHRSEGFGRGPAEAMVLGKPVVVTNFSGNTDFCLPHTACLVDYTLVPVGPGEYAYGEGQVWAEPDIDHAARHMRRLVEDAAFSRDLGAAAAAYMAEHHSAAAIGRRYTERLTALGLV